MDRELLKQCVSFHGASLFQKLQSEQIENPDFQAVAVDLSKAIQERKTDWNSTSGLVEQFIARKADLLFSRSWRVPNSQRPEYEEEETTEPYGRLPPLELFMEVPYEERRAMLYRDLEKGDVVLGRINNVREYGFFLTLLGTAAGMKRDIEDLDVSALCHIREIPSSGSHDDPLSYYQIGDFIRAGVKDIDRYQEKITVSLHQAVLCPGLEHVKLGVIAKEDLPTHYSQSSLVANDSTLTYERLLGGSHGSQNPCVVDYLLQKVGISDTQPPSLMRGLQSKLFDEDDFATSIRKKQSAMWALKSVRLGVDHFKNERHVEAMNEFNKALDIDNNNVEALVARGALYANKGSLVKAISDFELALETCPDHRNARKYLSQTLVERGRQLEEQEKLVTAEGLYRKSLSLDETNSEAQDALNRITLMIQKSIRLREEAMAKEKEQEEAKNSQTTSADKLRKILKDEKRLKKKRKRSTSSSSSSSSSKSSSSSSSSGSHRRSRKKKKKKKHRASKRQRRISSKESCRSDKHGEQEDGKEVEWDAPPIISGTFLNQREGPGFAARDVFAKDRTRSLSREVEAKQKLGNSWKDNNGNGRKSDFSRKDFETDASHISTSSADSHSRRSSFPNDSRKLANRDTSRRSSMESGKYERRNTEEASSSNAKGDDDTRSEGPKKELPTNLLDIFSQIEQFKKEKGVRPSK
ncbi:unnamed protein product [Knipowitschia caucasica]|uniref:S1 motif domain-containing protein n=1 Tax=Knipowitschia caucasica TaxID=637954 RepID=A0AAV2KWT4_KNICA